MFERDFDPAAYALRYESKLDRSAKLVRDHFAYQARAVSRFGRYGDRRTTTLPPFDFYMARFPVDTLVPIYLYVPARG
jgi:hypothetical protein